MSGHLNFARIVVTYILCIAFAGFISWRAIINIKFFNDDDEDFTALCLFPIVLFLSYIALEVFRFRYRILNLKKLYNVGVYFQVLITLFVTLPFMF